MRSCDEAVGQVAARLAQAARIRGVLPGWADAQIAATAIVEDMLIMTRNVRHFEDALGARVWDYSTQPEPPE